MEDELPELISAPRPKKTINTSINNETTTNNETTINDETVTNDEATANNEGGISTTATPIVEKTETSTATVSDETKRTRVEDEKNETNGQSNEPGTEKTGESVEVRKKKKKKKKKSASSSADIEFHDTELKEENEEPYDPNRPLSHRVEIAVQKYRKNRKFSNVRKDIFLSYLRFGGIETGQKSYLGQDGLDESDADADEIAARRATDYVEDDLVEEMDVDFTYNVTVFLSSYLIDKSGYVKLEQFREAPEVVISFINYLINHRVCPEYSEDMQTALEIAKRARTELPKCKTLAFVSPGRFNKVCSLLFGGELHGIFDDCWGSEEDVAKMIGISMKEATEYFKKVVGVEANSVSQIKKSLKKATHMTIVEVENDQSEQPTDADTSTTTENRNETSTPETNKASSTPLGRETLLRRLVLRERDNLDAPLITVFLDPEEIKHAMPNMSVVTDLHELSNGMWYWDRVTNIYPSYFLVAEDDSDIED